MPQTILIADDDRDLVSVLEDLLQAKGFACIVAYEGISAVEKAINEKPDLILLDWKMPAGKGSAVLEMLSEKDQTRSIPVIILSGAEEPGMFEISLKQGVKAFLKKPYDSAKLLKQIELALQ